MKSFLLFFCCIIVSFTSCNRSANEENSGLTETELKSLMSDSARLQSIDDWQKFKKESGESMLLAHEKLRQLEQKCSGIESTEKLAWRRIHTSSSQKLDQMQISLFRNGIKFRNNISQFTNADGLKNKSWCTNFTSKLNKVHADLDSCLNNDR